MEDDHVDKRKTIDNNGSLTVTVPAEIAEELDLEPGDDVVWSGRAGDDGAKLQKFSAETLLNALSDD